MVELHLELTHAIMLDGHSYGANVHLEYYVRIGYIRWRWKIQIQKGVSWADSEMPIR